MFETDAEEYAENTRIKDKNTYIGFPDERISELQDFEGNYIDISERIIKTFKDSAEFGYNKANEWHYVKDGDFPTEITEKEYLVALKSEYGGFFYEIDIWCKSLHCFASNNPKKVYAWKEIVPPKEIE